ncbi:hypothetical protein MKW98_031046 [Papaver atlanticum]|uniref:HAT C-terminal dimerisation domain-containing protein n=1 Tax=Papaver atlanticum TaxID=357466 RepID=A0AAD4SUS3_9MAGN|nr:hypothetical protein MKW98_031046 [Papaver atlanticum]
MDFIRKIKSAILYITHAPSRLQEFKKSCLNFSLKHRSFGLDVHNRWNSTYMMLKAIEGYETVILDALIDSDYELDMIDFDNCKVFTKFLGVFYTATKKLSGVYYSTTCIALNQLYNIAVAFKQCKDNRLYGRVIKLMEEKYLKYWEEIPPLFILGSVMDLRKKIIGTVVLIEGIANAFDREPLDSFASVHQMLLKLFNYYSSTHGSNVQTTMAQSQSDFDELDPSERLLSTFSTTASSGTSNTNSIYELVRYLELDVTVFLGSKELGSNFDILQFWNTHGNSFPILQIMARDLLTPPASTCAQRIGMTLGREDKSLMMNMRKSSQGSMVKFSLEGDSTFLTWISQSHESIQILFGLLISYAWNVQLCKAIFWMYIYQMFSLALQGFIQSGEMAYFGCIELVLC